MTWARLDDQLATRPEWVAISDVAMVRAAGSHPHVSRAELTELSRCLARDAKNVHRATLQWAVPALTDGRVSPAGVEQVCAQSSLTADEWYESAELLVATGAWKRLKPTKRDPLGAFQMVLGWSPGEQPTRAEDERRRRMATVRSRLREGARDYPSKLAAIERVSGRCEYCGRRLTADGGEIDHVDPELYSNDVDNLAYVCAGCNKRKGLHTLEAAGLGFTKRASDARSA